MCISQVISVFVFNDNNLLKIASHKYADPNSVSVKNVLTFNEMKGYWLLKYILKLYCIFLLYKISLDVKSYYKIINWFFNKLISELKILNSIIYFVVTSHGFPMN